MNHTTLGLDIAKSIFHYVIINANNRVIRQGKLRRNQLLDRLSNLKVDRIAMEACSSSHYWGRMFQELGHVVVLIPPHQVKPYVQGQKNDMNDALAIAEAAQRPGLKTVPVKTLAQQQVCALNNSRELKIKQRTQLRNSIRGQLAEYGLVTRQGKAALYGLIGRVLAGETELQGSLVMETLTQDFNLLRQLDEMIDVHDRQLREQAQHDADIKRLQQIPGIGPVTASALVAAVGNGAQFQCGRAMSSWLGLVPRQHSTGGRARLGRISKQGNRHLRTLLIHGARSVVRAAANKDDAFSLWVRELVVRRGYNKAAVAVANKTTRVAWVVLSQQIDYDPSRI